ncbi:Os06g0223200, partial [Oryza sativa Japonica Group]
WLRQHLTAPLCTPNLTGGDPIRQQFGFGFVCASRSSVVEPVQLHSNGNSDHTPKKSSESSLILIRHGESLWNEKNLFTGCVDVPLTPKGVEEAIEAGKRICSIPIDVIFTSSLIRAQMTAMLAMMQHRRKKVVHLAAAKCFCNHHVLFCKSTVLNSYVGL